jgi:hypothetical protein
MSAHTPTPGPWFVSGGRFRMGGCEWHSINRYDEAKKTDENIAIAGYDPRTGLGLADAHFIVLACNSHGELLGCMIDLFENPQFQVAIGGNPNMVDALMDRARAAISKAKGEAL